MRLQTTDIALAEGELIVNMPPQGPPPGWRPPQGPPPGWPPPRPPVKRPSRANLIIGLVAAAAALVIVVVFAAVVNSVVSEEDGPVTDEQRAANARTARMTSEYDVVCDRGSVPNAADYAKPYTIAPFYEGDTGTYHLMTLDAPYAGTGMTAPSSVNAVACLSVKAGSEVRSGSCEFESNGRDVEVDHYAVEYDVEVHEAKSGRLVTSLGTVKGPATDCPVIAYFGSGDRKIYGAPDQAAVTAKLAGFAAE